MNRNQILHTIVRQLKKEGARKIGMFGSYARRTSKAGSDIDLLVAFSKRKSLLELVRIERELSEKTGKKIDLLTEHSISPLIRDTVKRDLEELA